MLRNTQELIESDQEALEYVERMAKLNSPNGDVYGGKSADEVLIEIDSKRMYKPRGAYGCSICGNKGGISSYNKQTRQVWWKACSCLENKKTLSNTSKSGLGELLNYRVKDFVATDEFQKEMKSKAADYIRHATNEWFLALGQSGCGKTMLCSAICNQRLREGKVVKYLIWSEFISIIKTIKSEEDRNKHYHEYLKAEILYIDDLLKGNPTDYELKIAFQTINYRYNNKLPTVISSELLIDDLRKLDDAIASRMYQYAQDRFTIQVGKDSDKNYRFKGSQLDLGI